MSKSKIPVSDIEKIKKLYSIVKSVTKLANIYEVSKNGMYGFMRRHNIPLRKQGVASSYKHLRKIPLNKVDEVKEDYKKIRSISKLAKKYNMSKNGMYRFMKRNNFDIRKQGKHISPYTEINENAFKELNEFSEYWIGFLYADGNVHLKKRVGEGYTKTFQCFLSIIDEDHILKLIKFLKTDYSPRYRNISNTIIINGKNHIIEGQGVGIQITNDKLVDSLLEYGFSPRKSWSGSIHNEKLLKSRHFWRGMVDGDGSIGFYKNKKKNNYYPNLSLIANDETMKKFHKYIYNEILYDNIFESKTFNKSKTMRFKNLVGWNAFLIMNELYSDSLISLDRKKEKWLNIKSKWKPQRKRIEHTLKSMIADLLIQGRNAREVTEILDLSYSSVYSVKKIII